MSRSLVYALVWPIYLKLQDILHSRSLSIADTRMEEARRDRHSQRLARHSRVGPRRVTGDHAERAEEQHQQLLGVHGQGGY